MPEPGRQRLLLVGAGHAHLHLLDRAAELRPHYDLTLVAPRWFHYSGTASAVATGDLPPAAGRVDVAALAAARGVRHLEGRVEDLDPAGRTARTEDGGVVDLDLVSLNLGSVVRTDLVQGAEHAVPVKPLPGLAVLRASTGRRTTVVGGGSSALELAAHAAARGARVVLLARDLGGDLPSAARHRLRRLLVARGVDVREGVDVVSIGSGAVHLGDGSEVPHDLVVLATGLVAPPEVARWGLGDEAGVPVTATLTHPGHPHVLAAGDCARLLPGGLPRVGVHGVRQGPVLQAGLLARARGDAPAPYDPPRTWLSVLDLGGGRGLAVRGRWWWEGRAALALKRRIDRRWLAGYSVDPGPVGPTPG